MTEDQQMSILALMTEGEIGPDQARKILVAIGADPDDAADAVRDELNYAAEDHEP
jgi:hypothetical protein